MTNQEALILIKQHAGVIPAKEIAILCGKSYESIRGIAKRANVSLAVHPCYKKQEDEFIKKYIDTLSYEDIANIITSTLGLNYRRSADSIRHRAAELKIAGKSNQKASIHSVLVTEKFGSKWTHDEDRLLKTVSASDVTYAEVSQQLGRTIESCKARVKTIREQELRQKECPEYMNTLMISADY